MTSGFMRRMRWLCVSMLAVLVLAGCGAATAPTAVTGGAGEKPVTIGFLYVGPRDDYGYNYAADQGRLYLEQNFPGAKTIIAENVPENAEAERVMENMIQQGATIIFPTSYGHLDPAMRVAERHKDITFLHQGGLKNSTNVGTYFGEIWQMVYTSGVAAGKMTKSNKLGYVVAHPIPQVLLNINAFQLGARSVNPNVTTTVVFTGSWCDAAKQAEAANSLVDQGIDVITQHEDCPKPVIEVAERRGVMSIGYHADASAIAPKGWITGAMWVWGPTYTRLAQQAAAKSYKSELLRLGVKDGVVDIAPFGPGVPKDVQDLVLKAKADIISGTIFPFEGPIKDQSGTIRIEAGVRPDTSTLETTDWLVEGVVGSIPK
jgi:basic membrane protein A